MHITVEVEDNANCFGVPERIFETQGEPVKVARIRAYAPRGGYGWCRVTGWSSRGEGTPCEVRCVKVGDSGSGFAYLVFGGDWGVRLMSAEGPEAWSMDSSTQWGEPYLLLDDLSDVEAT